MFCESRALCDVTLKKERAFTFLPNIHVCYSWLEREKKNHLKIVYNKSYRLDEELHFKKITPHQNLQGLSATKLVTAYKYEQNMCVLHETVVTSWVLHEVLTGSREGRVGFLIDRLFLRELSFATKLHGMKLSSENCSMTCVDLLL